MVVDFREELNVARKTDFSGKPSFLCLYNYAWTREDLADGTVTILDSGLDISLGDICKKIDEFGGSELTIKARISRFLDKDHITISEEY